MPTMNDRDPISVALDCMIDVLDVAVEMTLTTNDYDEIAAEIVRLRMISARANLVLRLIEARQRHRLQTVQ